MHLKTRQIVAKPIVRGTIQAKSFCQNQSVASQVALFLEVRRVDPARGAEHGRDAYGRGRLGCEACAASLPCTRAIEFVDE